MKKLLGFTLIELLVVIAIIAILATLVVTRLTSAQAKARVADAKQDVAQVGKSIEVFRTDPDSGSFPIAATVVTAAAAANNCQTPAGVAKKCNTEYLGSASSATYMDPAGKWANIFSGSLKVAPTGGSTYGIKMNKTAAPGYIYTYYTAATATAPTTGAVSNSTAYSLVADIGTADASRTGNPRYVFYSSLSGTGNSGTATTYTPVLP
jgi:prepilin-type N-terminal cleavage/methylation domain-containing protein